MIEMKLVKNFVLVIKKPLFLYNYHSKIPNIKKNKYCMENII